MMAEVNKNDTAEDDDIILIHSKNEEDKAKYNSVCNNYTWKEEGSKESDEDNYRISSDILKAWIVSKKKN